MKTLSESLNSNSKWLPLLLIGFMAVMIFFYALGDFSLFNPDEGLYAEPAREMLDTGQFITTTLNYAVRFTKPPLIIWAMALAYKIFGTNEFAARFFCALSGCLLTISTYLLAAKYLNKRLAIFAACILLTAPLFIGVGRMAITDMPLSLFIAGALFCFFHSWKQKEDIWLYAAYVLTALAVMTKGPVGFLLPALILFAFFYLCSANKETLKFLKLPIGLSLLALIALPWFVIEIAITNGAYFQEFIMRENFARFTAVVDAHKGPWFYHLLAVIAGLFPWSILLPQATFNFAKTIIPYFKSARNSKPALFPSKYLNCCQNLSSDVQLLLLAFIFSLITILFFSVSVSKLLPYTLPCFPALAIIIAWQWDTFVSTHQKKRLVIYTATIFLLYLLVAFISPFALKFLRNAPPSLITLIFNYSALTAALIFFALAITLLNKELFASFFLFSIMTINSAFFLPKFLSTICQSWEGETSQYARLAARSQNELIVYRLRKPAIPFYFGRKVIQATDKESLALLTKKAGLCYLITSRKDIADAKANGYRILNEKDNFALLINNR